MLENTFLRIILLSIGAYFLALLSSRLIGRKVISQMTFFYFVTGVTLGSVTSDIVLSDHGPLEGATMLVTITVITLIMGLSYIKSMKIRKLVNSEPVVVIGIDRSGSIYVSKRQNSSEFHGKYGID